MLDDDRVGPDLYLFDHQPQHALAIGHPEGLRGTVEFGEKAFETLLGLAMLHGPTTYNRLYRSE